MYSAILFFPEQWSDIFLDFSKNEILTLLLLYRKKKANKTEIAEYIIAPLNTATVVISRLEKKLMVDRIRSVEDRRIVLITLTEAASSVIEMEKAMITKYFIKYISTIEINMLALLSAILPINLSLVMKAKNNHIGLYW
ncbi:MarR family transcriptional regulator [Clostridium sp.]|uniref:transcriptional regulator, SarA/Rot family n=1 Tax=Clostridium sp. TaxID=1506 RepID=UPI001A37C20B|nr:MarR family transcriptional regulator [Clostridium sp.]MBK5241705.1 MarR family transcriptional regulator [Clostridium sp.]